MGAAKYDDNFKRAVVAASYAGDESVLSVSRRYGVATSAIYGWRKLYADGESVTSASEDPAFFVPICIEDDPSALPNSASRPVAKRVDFRITVKCGVDREIAVLGAFDVDGLVQFVRGVTT